MLPPSFLSSYIDRAYPMPIVAPRASLPSSLRFVSMCDVLPSAVFSSYSSSVLLRTDIHMERLIRPHVYASRNEYVELVKRMRGLGMLGCTMQPRCVNGVFGVRKDENNIRLIIDARNANRYFIEPPHVLLPDPSFLTRLVLPPHVHLFVSKCDLSNFYHHIALPDWMHPFFALPPLTVREWNGVEDVFVGDNNGPDVYPTCMTLPVGWSHSVFIAQSIHEHILYKSGTCLHLII